MDLTNLAKHARDLSSPADPIMRQALLALSISPSITIADEVSLRRVVWKGHIPETMLHLTLGKEDRRIVNVWSYRALAQAAHLQGVLEQDFRRMVEAISRPAY